MSAPVGHRFYQNWLSKFTWVNTSTLLNSSLIHPGTMSSLEHQHLVIPKHPPRRDIWDILSWIDCWIAYCQVVLNFSPSHSVELLKNLDLIVRTHRSFPSQTSGSSTIRDSGGKPHAPWHLSTGGPLT